MKRALFFLSLKCVFRKVSCFHPLQNLEPDNVLFCGLNITAFSILFVSFNLSFDIFIFSLGQ